MRDFYFHGFKDFRYDISFLLLEKLRYRGQDIPRYPRPIKSRLASSNDLDRGCMSLNEMTLEAYKEDNSSRGESLTVDKSTPKPQVEVEGVTTKPMPRVGKSMAKIPARFELVDKSTGIV